MVVCKCFNKMLERGYAEKRSYYDEAKKDFIETDEHIMRLAIGYIRVNNCPICGERVK